MIWRDLARVVAADHAVLAHHARALLEGHRVPVLRLAAPLVHRDRSRRSRRAGISRKSAAHDALRAARPSRRRRPSRTPASRGSGPCSAAGRGSWPSSRTCRARRSRRRTWWARGRAPSAGGRRASCAACSCVEVAAEVDEHQVALVAEEGREGGRPVLAVRHRGQGVHRGRRPLAPLAVGQGPPGLPADPEHLVEQAPALEGLGYAWIVHHHESDSRPMRPRPMPDKVLQAWGRRDLERGTAGRTILVCRARLGGSRRGRDP